MKLYSWNVNGLRACMNKGFADFFSIAYKIIFVKIFILPAAT